MMTILETLELSSAEEAEKYYNSEAWQRKVNGIIIPPLRHFTIFGQENAHNMRR